MADINLTQDEADKLMAMEKRAADEKEWLFPPPGERLAIPLTSSESRSGLCLACIDVHPRGSRWLVANRLSTPSTDHLG